MASRNNTSNSSGKSRKGFAAMDKNKQREIASMGGRASHGGGRNRSSSSSSSRSHRAETE